MEIIKKFAQNIIHIVNTQHFFQPFMEKYLLGFASYFAQKNIGWHLHFYCFLGGQKKNVTRLEKNKIIHCFFSLMHVCGMYVNP